MIAIGKAEARDCRAVLNAMTALRDVDGLGGRFTFDINGHITITSVSGSAVHNGTFQYIDTLAP